MRKSTDSAKPTLPTTPAEPAARDPRPAFERPELQKRGELPRVTTAFGGSFTP
jgi:hypothetical protein